MNQSGEHTVLDDWIVYPAMALGIAVTTILPIGLGQRMALPLLSTLVIVPMFFWAVRQGRPDRAIRFALFWAGVQSLCVLIASLLFDTAGGQAISGGVEYRDAWLRWAEHGSPVMTAPATSFFAQVRETLAFAAASALTGGAGSLAMLTLTLDRVNFTAASLLHGAQQPLLGLLAAWPIWLIVRLVGLVMLGAVLAEPLANADLWPGYLSWWARHRRRMLAGSVTLLLLATALQAALTPLYQTLMRAAG
ncbi:MAG: hypothetical protein ABTQ73_05210 [Caldilineales bacterium]